MKNKWNLIEHPAHYQITNGPISLCTGEDDADTDEWLLPIVDALNECPFPLHCELVEDLRQARLSLTSLRYSLDCRTKECQKAQEREKVLVEALEKIKHAPVPANEREYISWFVTAKNVAAGAISELEAVKEVASYTQGKEVDNG